MNVLPIEVPPEIEYTDVETELRSIWGDTPEYVIAKYDGRFEGIEISLKMERRQKWLRQINELTTREVADEATRAVLISLIRYLEEDL